MDCSTFSNVPGATAQSFTPDTDGDYAVVITKEQCKDTSVCTSVQGVGILENAATDFVIYPNPASSAISVQSNAPIESVLIYSLQGELVLTAQTNYVAVEQLPAGMYLIQVNTASSRGYSRFLKQ